ARIIKRWNNWINIHRARWYGCCCVDGRNIVSPMQAYHAPGKNRIRPSIGPVRIISADDQCIRGDRKDTISENNGIIRRSQSRGHDWISPRLAVVVRRGGQKERAAQYVSVLVVDKTTNVGGKRGVV